MQTKRYLVLFVLAVAILATARQAAPPADPNGIIYLDADKVAAAFAKGGPLIPADPSRNFFVLAGRRDSGPGQVELHTVDTDVFYVLEGSGMFVTGGKMLDGKETAPNEQRGSSIEGGQTRTLKKGDVIVIPKGVPHWFRQISPPFLYFVVKVH